MGKFKTSCERGNRHGVSFVQLSINNKEITNKKYVIEVQTENSRKLDYYTECISDENKTNKKLKA